MARVRKREAARRDLIQRWVWYAENAGIDTADRFLSAVESATELLAGQPEAGSKISIGRVELRGIRRFPLSGGFEKILLFYFPLQDGIDLVRVIHGNQDIHRLLLEGCAS